jgi:predicted alpha/beta-fold hydrolase
MGTPYIAKLSSELENINWSFCQIHMRSSYLGYGTGSLLRDSEDIRACIKYLRDNGKQHIFLMGHSTGAQNSLHYVKATANSDPGSVVDGVIVEPFFAES